MSQSEEKKPLPLEWQKRRDQLAWDFYDKNSVKYAEISANNDLVIDPIFGCFCYGYDAAYHDLEAKLLDLHEKIKEEQEMRASCERGLSNISGLNDRKTKRIQEYKERLSSATKLIEVLKTYFGNKYSDSYNKSLWQRCTDWLKGSK